MFVSTFASAQMHDHGASASGDGQFNPFIISDNHGGFYVSYMDRKSGSSNVMIQRSTATSGFTNGVRVNNRPGDGTVRNENPPKVAVGPGNDVYVVWANERERWKGNIRFARSTNGGKTFEPAIDLNSDSAAAPVSRAFESIAVDANGRIFVAWIDERNKTDRDRGAEVWIAISEDRGRTFTRDRKIVSGVCECCRTALAIDSAGRIFLSYRSVPSSGPMYRDIAIARSDDQGKTFKSAILSHDGWKLDACPIAGATMTVDSADRIFVVWFTTSKDVPRLFAASSVDHGMTFSKPAVFDSNQKLAKHAHIVPVSAGRTLVAWDDVNGSSLVKWGYLDSTMKLESLTGTEANASYPVIAISGGRIGIVALLPDGTGLLRTIRTVSE
jgi:hypothetical protein